MSDDRIFKKQCPFCKNWLNIDELLPNGTKISFFSDFVLVNGRFSSGRCFSSISGQKRKEKKKEEELEFKRNEPKEVF